MEARGRQIALDRVYELKSKFRCRVYPVLEAATPSIYFHTVIAQTIANKPRVLRYLGPFRSLNDANRRRALRGKGYAGELLSWDEYPYASTLEGGLGAWVTAVPVWEQNVQATALRVFYQIHKMKPADKFYVVTIGGRTN